MSSEAATNHDLRTMNLAQRTGRSHTSKDLTIAWLGWVGGMRLGGWREEAGGSDCGGG